MSVVVLGDANLDLEIRLPDPAASALQANPEPRLFGGGSAANTAAALARLGVPCRFVGTVGDDSYGRAAVGELDSVGVDTSLVRTAGEQPTLVVLVVVPPDGERLVYPWPPTGGAHGALEPDHAASSVADASWLHISGICLRWSPAREASLAAMERARSEGAVVSFDLNLRLENWGWDRGFRRAVDDAVDRSDVVVGSASDEVSALTGVNDPADAAKALADDRRLVVARLGAAGALASDGREVTQAAGFAVDVVDTVGAGDAFNAGFIAARMQGSELPVALRWGNAVAALTISASGARSTPTRLDLETLLSS